MRLGLLTAWPSLSSFDLLEDMLWFNGRYEGLYAIGLEYKIDLKNI